jgi:hypothetical protein
MIEFQSLISLIRDMVRIIRGSVETESETISDIQVEFWIHQYRAMLIKQDIDKGKSPNPDYIQEIKGIHLSSVPTTEISNITTGKYVLRSDLQLPKTLDLNNKNAIMYVGTMDGREIQFVPQGRARWQEYKNYTSKDPICYLKNRYLYVVNGDVINYIDIRGVFEIPTEVMLFKNPLTGTPSYDIYNDKYPIPTNWVPSLKQLIIQKEFGVMINSQSDTKEDSTNDLLHGPHETYKQTGQE